MYFFVRERGKYSFYIRKIVKFAAHEPAQAYVAPKPNRFVREPDMYYLQIENNLPVQIQSKKELISNLEGNETALAYIRKSRIKVNEEDLTSLVRFLNSH